MNSPRPLRFNVFHRASRPTTAPLGVRCPAAAP